MDATYHDIYSEISAIISGLIGGGRYGFKIRLPHAAVMTLLFRKNATVEEKLKIVLKSTMEHSRNLASFAAIYKVRIISPLRFFTVLHSSEKENN